MGTWDTLRQLEPPEVLAPESKRGWRLEISHVGNTDGGSITTAQLKASLVGWQGPVPTPWPAAGNPDQDSDALGRGRKQNKAQGHDHHIPASNSKGERSPNLNLGLRDGYEGFVLFYSNQHDGTYFLTLIGC